MLAGVLAGSLTCAIGPPALTLPAGLLLDPLAPTLAAADTASRAHALNQIDDANQSSTTDMASRLGGSFSISPAQRTVVAWPPVELSSTRVANTTETTLHVRAYPVLLSQVPSGAFTFDPAAAELARAERVLQAAPARFTLAPGATREVTLRWRSLPPGARAAAVGVVYQATPPSDGAPVQTVERLLGVDVLSLPGAHRRSGALTGLHVDQQAPGVLRFTADVRNTGQAVAGPRQLELSVRDRHGAQLVRGAVATDIVLPGATRDFSIDVAPAGADGDAADGDAAADLARRLPAGRYTATVSLAYGSGRLRSASLPFALAGANALTAPHLLVGPITAQGTVGASAQVTATLANTGTAAAHPVVELRLFQVGGRGTRRSPVAERRVAPGALAPGARRRVQIGLGRLRRGTYMLSAVYRDADGTPQTLVADFQAQPPVAPLTRVRQWLQRHPLLAPLLTLGLSLVLSAAAWRAGRAAPCPACRGRWPARS